MHTNGFLNVDRICGGAIFLNIPVSYFSLLFLYHSHDTGMIIVHFDLKSRILCLILFVVVVKK